MFYSVDIHGSPYQNIEIPNLKSYKEGKKRKKKIRRIPSCTNFPLNQSSIYNKFSIPRHKLLSTLPRRSHISLIVHTLFIILSLVSIGEVGGSKLRREVRQRFANEPSPQTAVIGSTVVLPCRVIGKVGELQWTRDDFGLGNERELFAFKRYKMIGSHEEGDYSLRISPVTLEDDAEFQCQVLGVGDVSGVRSQSAKLTVYVPPERPEIVQGPVVSTTAGNGVQIECISKGGKPAAEIQWLDGAGREFRQGVVYTTEMLEDNHRQNAKSSLSFVATKDHHSTIITCTSSNPAINQPLSTQVRLEVTYSPEVTVRHSKKSYKEGETATLNCEATANPSVLSFRWFRGSTLLSTNNSTQLVLKNVSRENNMEDIICEVSNAVGTSKEITRIDVQYGPYFTREPEDTFASPGEEVSLVCSVDSNPQSTIVWVGQQEQSVVDRGAEMRLKAGPETVGNYLCIAKVQGFQEISASFGLFLKGPPIVQAQEKQWGHLGDTITLDCTIRAASPRSVVVTWSKYGDEVDLAPGRFEELEEITSTGLKHSLLIHNANHHDFGSYNCSAHNNYGHATTRTVLGLKKGIPVVLLAGGLALTLLFVVVLCAFVIFFWRRSSTKQKEMKTNGDLSEKTVNLQLNHCSNSSGSDLKVDLDDRSASSLSHIKDATDLESSEKEGNGINGIQFGYIGNNGTLSRNKERTANTLPSVVSSPNNAPSPPSYHLTTAPPSYMYPEGFSRMAYKNGQVMHNGSYGGHDTLPAQKPGVITSGFSSSAMNHGYSTLGSPYSQGPLVTTNQRDHFPNYGDYAISAVDHGDTMPVCEFTEKQYVPMSFAHHVTLRKDESPHGVSSAAYTIPQTHAESTSQSPNLPRLGVPADSSQYIMPPRTQVMQGALATHV